MIQKKITSVYDCASNAANGGVKRAAKNGAKRLFQRCGEGCSGNQPFTLELYKAGVG